MDIKYIIEKRIAYYPLTTISTINISNKVIAFGLEDTVRPYGIKIKRYTAIPENIDGYDVGIRYSNKFKRNVLVLSTEEDGFTIRHLGTFFTYVYIHGGNKHQDTDGCILVGFNRKGNLIYNTAESSIFNLVSTWINDGYIVRWVIINEQQLK